MAAEFVEQNPFQTLVSDINAENYIGNQAFRAAWGRFGGPRGNIPKTLATWFGLVSVPGQPLIDFFDFVFVLRLVGEEFFCLGGQLSA